MSESSGVGLEELMLLQIPQSTAARGRLYLLLGRHSKPAERTLLGGTELGQ